MALALTSLAIALAWFGSVPDQAMAAPQHLACAEARSGYPHASGVDTTDIVLCDDLEEREPSGAVACGNFFGFGDRCAVRSSEPLRFSPLTDLYVRWYQYISGPADATQPDGSVTLSDASRTLKLSMVPDSSEPWSIILDPGRWYVFEWHVRLNSPGNADGLTELWIDDTTQPSGLRTLRMSRADMQWVSSENPQAAVEVMQITCGTEERSCSDPSKPFDQRRWDRIVISRSPIGPLKGMRPPAPPGGLRISQ